MIYMGDEISRKEDWSTVPKTILEESKKLTNENTDEEALTVNDDIMITNGEALEEAANEDMMMSLYEKGELQPEDL